MAHNFHQTTPNAVYVSKAAIPDTGTGTPDNPFATIAQAVDGFTDVVIGTGTYTEVGLQDYNATKRLIGDGKVVLKGAGTGVFISLSKFHLFENLEIRDYEFLIQNNYEQVSVNRCILRNGKAQLLQDGGDLVDILVDSTAIGATVIVTGNAGGPAIKLQSISNNLFIGSTLDILRTGCTPTFCYFDTNAVLKLWSASFLPRNCNIRGSLVIAGTTYASLADAAVAYPALTSTLGNFSKDPQFNRPDTEDYTLRLSSPHLETGIGPRHLRYALMYYVEFDDAPGDACTISNTRLRSTTGAVINFLAISGFTVNGQGGLVISSNVQGAFEASYTTDRIRVASVPQPIELLPVIFAGNFDTAYPRTEGGFSSQIPEPRNNNVPAYYKYASGQAGRNPHRLSVQVRFSPNLSPDVNQAGEWVGGVYYDLEIDAKPTYNPLTGLGNAHANYAITSQETQVEARWVQLRYLSRNDYYSR